MYDGASAAAELFALRGTHVQCPRCGKGIPYEWGYGLFQCSGGTVPTGLYDTVAPADSVNWSGPLVPITLMGYRRCGWRWHLTPNPGSEHPRCSAPDCTWVGAGQCRFCNSVICTQHATWDDQHGAACESHYNDLHRLTAKSMSPPEPPPSAPLPAPRPARRWWQRN
jgi:hypothetical protein